MGTTTYILLQNTICSFLDKERTYWVYVPLLLDGGTLLKSGGMSKNGAPSLAVSRSGTKKNLEQLAPKKKVFLWVTVSFLSLFSGSNSNLGQFIWGRGGGGGARLHAPRKKKREEN